MYYMITVPKVKICVFLHFVFKPLFVFSFIKLEYSKTEMMLFSHFKQNNKDLMNGINPFDLKAKMQ